MPLNKARPLASSVQVDAAGLRYDGGACAVEQHAIAVETPVNIIYGSIPFAVMMTSPADWEDFAYGFSFTEGVIDCADDIRRVTVEEVSGGVMLSIALRAELMQRHLGRSRNLSGRTGCGVCGIADLSAMPVAAALQDPALRLDPAAIAVALANAQELQVLNRQTRAVHGAAFCDRHGSIVALREDVGRHNALDKLIGVLLRQGVSAGDGFVLITSRASFEMIEKTVRFGSSVLVAMSAPTSLAIERANTYGLTLVAVARDDGAIVFSSGPVQLESKT